MSNEKKLWFSTGSGRIEFELTLEDARHGSHQGQCDSDVKDLSEVPYIKEQLDKIDPELLSDELREYGAWDETERADHAQNTQRILWLACGDIQEEAAQAAEENENE
jgi:hypothetical protein